MSTDIISLKFMNMETETDIEKSRYIVKNNDTIESISLKYNILPSQLLKYNKLISRTLFPGQIMKIPYNNSSPSTRNRSSTVANMTSKDYKTTSPIRTQSFKQYTSRVTFDQNVKQEESDTKELMVNKNTPVKNNNNNTSQGELLNDFIEEHDPAIQNFVKCRSIALDFRENSALHLPLHTTLGTLLFAPNMVMFDCDKKIIDNSNQHVKDDESKSHFYSHETDENNAILKDESLIYNDKITALQEMDTCSKSMSRPVQDLEKIELYKDVYILKNDAESKKHELSTYWESNPTINSWFKPINLIACWDAALTVQSPDLDKYIQKFDKTKAHKESLTTPGVRTSISSHLIQFTKYLLFENDPTYHHTSSSDTESSSRSKSPENNLTTHHHHQNKKENHVPNDDDKNILDETKDYNKSLKAILSTIYCKDSKIDNNSITANIEQDTLATNKKLWKDVFSQDVPLIINEKLKQLNVTSDNKASETNTNSQDVKPIFMHLTFCQTSSNNDKSESNKDNQTVSDNPIETTNDFWYCMSELDAIMIIKFIRENVKLRISPKSVMSRTISLPANTESKIGDDWQILEQSPKSPTSNVVYDEKPCMLDNSDIMDESQIKQISRELPARAIGYNWILVYSTQRDGYSLQTMFRKMHESADPDSPVLLVVRDTSSNIFGALASCPIEQQEYFFGTGESFLYTFYPDFKVYHWTGDNNCIIQANSDYIAFGVSKGQYGLWIDADFNHGRTHECSTFGNEPLTCKEDFMVDTVEIWCFGDQNLIPVTSSQSKSLTGNNLLQSLSNERRRKTIGN